MRYEKNNRSEEQEMSFKSNHSISKMSLDEYGRALESNDIISLNQCGFIVDNLSGNILSTNDEQLDLLIAYLESLRGKMNNLKLI